MARHGVDFEAVKHAALKLLSKGSAPSVQKIRDMLGTGSNSTIAEHLKVWRATHAAKKVHHLPATIPDTLITTLETVWQTAMEQAEQHFAEAKDALNQQEETFHADKAYYEKSNQELRASHADALKSIEYKSSHIQNLQTEIAIVNEKLKQQIKKTLDLKNQYDNKLNRAYSEKDHEFEKSEKLHSEITRLNQQFNEQLAKHQNQLNEQRNLQEASEQRWLLLIDQAHTETNEQRKRYENTLNKHIRQIETLQSVIVDLQQKQSAQRSIAEEKDTRIIELSKQYQHMQLKYQETATILAVWQERYSQIIKKTSLIKKTESQLI